METTEITKTNHLKNDLSRLYFCIKALSKSKKELRAHVTHLLIKDNIATGTNGHRLHRAKLTYQYDDGLYQIVKKIKSHVIMTKTDEPLSAYPDTEHIFKATDHFEKELLSFETKEIFVSYARIIRKMPEEYTVNFYFLKDLDDSFNVQIPRIGAPILFDNALFSAAIMPIPTGF